MMSIKTILRVCAVVVCILSAQGFGKVSVPPLIGDHMVLQRDMKVRIWGWADPGEKVNVEIAGRKGNATTDRAGKWSIQLAPMKAGGPFEMTIRGKNTIVIKNILVGDIWVCSGQSNMQMSVLAAANSAQEIAAANYPGIRFFEVGNFCAGKPRTNVMGRWQVCSPQSVPHFSAAGYFFGRKLHQDLKVPIGLINSVWGGTPAETWMNMDDYLALGNLSSVKSFRKDVWDNPAGKADLLKQIDNWEKYAYAKDPGNKGYGQGWATLQLDTAGWKAIELPKTMECALGKDIDGVFWFRRRVDIPAEWAGKDLVLRLGPIDDADTTYFNNIQVGQTGDETGPAWSVFRKYRIPGNRVKAGPNVIAVRVFDLWLDGGFCGKKEDMVLGRVQNKENLISLAGPWLYKIESSVDARPREMSMNTSLCSYPGVLYNGMIAPLTPMTIRGAIWYQGEANTGRISWEYHAFLTALIRNWRRVWNQGDFPFLIVQLANFGQPSAEPGESGWAQIRDAQLKTTQTLKNTGLAMAIDIGDAVNIHPVNKQEVGRRLALWALANVYGRNVVFSGPVYQSMKIEGRQIRLTFDPIGGGLVAKGDKLTGFAIAGADMKFVWAQAKIEGGKVIVWSDKVAKPMAVRYAWADNPTCNLYNQAGLPASPFRADK
jgi:sialate O-acetylesterase